MHKHDAKLSEQLSRAVPMPSGPLFNTLRYADPQSSGLIQRCNLTMAVNTSNHRSARLPHAYTSSAYGLRHARPIIQTRIKNSSSEPAVLVAFLLRGGLQSHHFAVLAGPTLSKRFYKTPVTFGPAEPRSPVLPSTLQVEVQGSVTCETPSPTPTGRGHATSGPEQRTFGTPTCKMPQKRERKAKECPPATRHVGG